MNKLGSFHAWTLRDLSEDQLPVPDLPIPRLQRKGSDQFDPAAIHDDIPLRGDLDKQRLAVTIYQEDARRVAILFDNDLTLRQLWHLNHHRPAAGFFN